MERREFRKHVFRTGGKFKQFQMIIPMHIIRELKIEDHDEVEIWIRKTGQVIPKQEKKPTKPFGIESKNEVKKVPEQETPESRYNLQEVQL